MTETTPEYPEMTPEIIRQKVNEAYPELGVFIAKATESLYNALWFGTITEPLLGFKSATQIYLESESWRPFLDTDAGRLNVAAGLVNFAEHDAWYEALVSGAGYELVDLEHAPRCPKCAGIVDIDCLCDDLLGAARRQEAEIEEAKKQEANDEAS